MFQALIGELVVLHLSSHKSLNENEEQTKAKTRGVLIDREKNRCNFHATD